MIVVDPDGIVGLVHTQDGISKRLIHFHVLSPVCLPELCVCRKIMEQGP